MNTNIRVETHPNFEVRSYHPNFEISKSPIENFWRPVRPDSKEYLKKLGRKGAALVRRLLKIPGVAEVTIQPYEVSVHKGLNFPWDDIQPAVLETIEMSMPKGLREAGQEVEQQ